MIEDKKSYNNNFESKKKEMKKVVKNELVERVRIDYLKSKKKSQIINFDLYFT